MKIIFLDIDGVLNNRKWFRQITNHPQYKTKSWIDRQFEPRAINLLNDLVANTNAEIVVSSSWRMGHEKNELQKILQDAGLKYPLKDYTPPARHLTSIRGMEIKEWLQDHPNTTSFVILDDNSDMGQFINKLIQTSFNHGLQQNHIAKAIKILNGEI